MIWWLFHYIYTLSLKKAAKRAYLFISGVPTCRKKITGVSPVIHSYVLRLFSEVLLLQVRHR